MFDTPLGKVGVAWGSAGLTALRLPARTPRETERSLAQAAGTSRATPPDWVDPVLEAIAYHLGGDVQDFTEVRLDVSGEPAFHRRVYEELRLVPAGRTVTYAELARRAGAPDAARAVGQAMKTNPLPLLIPCHRVLAAGGRSGGFSAPGGVATKERLLGLEGERFDFGEGVS